MKKFLTYLFIFAASIAIIDMAFGYFCSYLNNHAKGGDTYNHFYIANEMTDSVLIFGSSRAIHHYNPIILEDSLHTTVYNCGLDGNGIIYNYGRLLTILNHHKPKAIVYDVMPAFDMADDDCSKYLNWQKRWFDIPGIAEIFHDVNPAEDIKMRSNLYRYNTSFIQMLSDNIRPMQEIMSKGFKPSTGTIDYDVESEESEPTVWSELKLKYFTKFVELCKENDIELIISYSPSYKATNSHIFDEFTAFAMQHRLDIVDLYDDPDICFNKDYFVDSSHLNSRGADVFTAQFAHELNRILTRK